MTTSQSNFTRYDAAPAALMEARLDALDAIVGQILRSDASAERTSSRRSPMPTLSDHGAEKRISEAFARIRVLEASIAMKWGEEPKRLQLAEERIRNLTDDVLREVETARRISLEGLDQRGRRLDADFARAEVIASRCAELEPAPEATERLEAQIKAIRRRAVCARDCAVCALIAAVSIGAFVAFC